MNNKNSKKSEELVEMLSDAERREQGFRILMQQYGQKLYWHIRRIIVGHDDAEDVLQETFIKIYDNIGSLKGKEKLATWIYTIATNEALAVLRRQKRFYQSLDDAMGEILTSKLKAENPIDGNKAEVLFQEALLQLPTQQRIAFNLRYYDELSYDDIAKITGKNVGTLKTNYHYAAEKVKKYIKEHTE